MVSAVDSNASQTHLKQFIVALLCFPSRLANPEEGFEGITKLTLGEGASGPALGPVQLAEKRF